MRNPFVLKNSISHENRQIQENDETISFEESVLAPERAEILERDSDPKLNIRILWFLTIIAFTLLFSRLYYLAIGKHDYYREIAEGNRLRVEYIAAPRGAIYDAFGQSLAGNKPSFELVANPLDLPKEQSELEREVAKIAEILLVSPQEIKDIVTKPEVRIYESVLVKQNIEREQALIFNEQASDLAGFRVINTPIRDYKNPYVYAHLLGFVGKISPEEYQEKSQLGYLYNDVLGKTGLEQIYESDLRGTLGRREVEVDARGIVKKVFGEQESDSGKGLYLNIDAGLEEKLYKALTHRLSHLGRKKASAIAMNPQNGKILAFVSLPSYNTNLFAEGISPEEYQNLLDDKDKPLFNRSIAGTYPPGSIVKPMVAAAALQEGVITDKTVIEDRGQIIIKNIYGGPDFYFYGYAHRALGSLDVRKAIMLSSDIFFYIIGGGYEPLKIKGLGIEKLADYFRKFQIDKKLGIDLPSEQDGLVPTPAWKQERFASNPTASRWYLGDTYHVSIGQGDLLVTPLHVLSWTAAIANGGKIFRPYIVDRIIDNDGTVVKQFAPETLSELGIAPEYLQIVREGMRKVVTEGTAKSLNDLPIAVAGKTGTAQFDARNPYRTHAWFTAFAPYDDPQIAIMVMIEDGGEGSINAAPVVKEALEWWAKNRYGNR